MSGISRRQPAGSSPLRARPWAEAAIARAAALACRLEASAEKPGNVTPRHAFPEMSHGDLLASADAVAPELGKAAGRPVGVTILRAVEATRRVTRANTNLGTVLLLAPLARAAARGREDVPPAEPAQAGAQPETEGAAQADLRGKAQPEAAPSAWHPARSGSASGRQRALRAALRAVLRGLDVRDAELAYRAIRLAGPGGMGLAPAQDLAGTPTVTLLEAMRLAADRDLVAREYATDFEITFESGLPLLDEALAAGLPLTEAIVDLFLELLRRFPDSLVERKFGRQTAEEVSARTAAALAASLRGSPDRAREVESFDRWLRDPSRGWNPGTTADLVAATLFVWLLCTGDPAAAPVLEVAGRDALTPHPS